MSAPHSEGLGRPRFRIPSGRETIFIVEIVYLLLLAVIFFVYEISSGVRSALPSSLGALPLGVPWFGAVGGTLISLTGVFKHADSWDPRLELWHWGRPLVGAFVGSIGALMFLVIVDSAAAQPKNTNAAVFDVVAFLVGYREETFRSLIKRATDLLLSPGAPRADSPIAAPPASPLPASAAEQPGEGEPGSG
jgi:hypothetical protein